MLNEEVQAWIDLGFSEEEAIVMADTIKSRNDDVQITDEDSIVSLTKSVRNNMS